MPALIALLAAVAGVLNTAQAGANTTLSKTLGQPLVAALVVTGVNALVYLSAIPLIGFAWPGGGRFAQVPWWAWLGGAMGGFYVLAVILLAERLGAAIFTGLSVTAAIATSTILDHYGLMGFARHEAGLWRVLGCLLMVGGLALVSIF